MKIWFFLIFAVSFSFDARANFVNLTRDCEGMPFEFISENLVVMHTYKASNFGGYFAWFGFISPRTGIVIDVADSSTNGCRDFVISEGLNDVKCNNLHYGTIGSGNSGKYRFRPDRPVELRGSCDPMKRAPLTLHFK